MLSFIYLLITRALQGYTFTTQRLNAALSRLTGLSPPFFLLSTVIKRLTTVIKRL